MEAISLYVVVVAGVALLVLPILTIAAAYFHRKAQKRNREELNQQIEELHPKGR